MIQISSTVSNKTKRPKKTRRAEGFRKDSKYLAFRDAVLKRDKYHCRRCDSNKKLTVHHIKYLKGNEGLAYETKNGITLCRECHDLRHNKKSTKSTIKNPLLH